MRKTHGQTICHSRLKALIKMKKFAPRLCYGCLMGAIAALNYFAIPSIAAPPVHPSTGVHSGSKAKGRPGSAKGATASKKAKAEALERKIQAQIAAKHDSPIATLISPQNNFVLRIDEAGDKITFYRTFDGKAVSHLVVPKDMDPMAIGTVDVSDDERLIIVYFPIAHNRHECLLYERVRPFVYHFSKFCPGGSLNGALADRGRDSDIVGIQWASGSRYLLIPSYDKDLSKPYSTTRFDTRTGRVTVLHRRARPNKSGRH